MKAGLFPEDAKEATDIVDSQSQPVIPHTIWFDPISKKFILLHSRFFFTFSCQQFYFLLFFLYSCICFLVKLQLTLFVSGISTLLLYCVNKL